MGHLPALCTLTARSAAALAEVLPGLVVDGARMRRNLDAAGGVARAEGLVAALAPHVGRGEALALAETACPGALAEGRTLADVAAATPPLTAEFQDLITRYAWGEIWTRPGLDVRSRRILVIGTMVTLGRWDELQMHIRAALDHGGISADDIKEIILQQAGPEPAPALVLSNSLGTDASLWDRQVEAFTTRYRVLRYDTRGHGPCAAPAGDYAIDRLGGDVLSLMTAAGLARAHVCGVSIGGLPAPWLGVHAPDRVGRLVLANTAAKIGTPALWADRMRVARDEGLEPLADLTMPRWLSDGFRASLVALPAAHLSNVECAEAFTAAVLGFLDGASGG